MFSINFSRRLLYSFGWCFFIWMVSIRTRLYNSGSWQNVPIRRGRTVIPAKGRGLSRNLCPTYPGERLFRPLSFGPVVPFFGIALCSIRTICCGDVAGRIFGGLCHRAFSWWCCLSSRNTRLLPRHRDTRRCCRLLAFLA